MNCRTCRLRYRAYLSSKFQKFAVQCVVLLGGLVSQFFDLEAELPLPPDRKDGEDGSG